MPEDGGAAGARFGDHALDLLARHERAHGIVHQNNFGGGIHLRERIRHGLLARIAAMNHARGTAQRRFRDFILQEDDVIGARRNKKVGDGWARGQPPQRENNQRHAVEFEELLRLVGAHAGAETGGGNDGCNSCSLEG